MTLKQIAEQAGVGDAAAGLLLQRIVRPVAKPERVVLPCRLVVRDT